MQDWEDDDSSRYLFKEPCPACGSRDNLARYSDGHGFCFGCGHREKGDGETEKPKGRMLSADLITDGEVRDLPKRGLTQETCARWGYKLGDYKGKKVQIAPYYDAEGNVVAQKLRFPDKTFTTVGDFKKATFFGSHLWGKGRKLVVTEGEIDAMSVSQMQDHKWPVVSIPNGAQGAARAFRKGLEYLSGYDEVIIMFDQDEPGQAAAQECAAILPPGKAKIAYLALKDPNELLKASRGDEIIKAIWNAKTFRPDGIVAGVDLWEDVCKEEVNHSVPYPWAGLNDKTRGARKGELVVITAGSGIGKSAICREIAHYLMTKHGETVGYIALEENKRRTALGLMGIEINRPLHLDRSGVSEEELKKAFDATAGSGKLYLYDHFGSTEIENLMQRLRYLAVSCECGWIILDHLSIVVSALEGDERKIIDQAMTHIRTLVEETGIGLFLVSHLKRPEGKGHEDGAQTSLSQLRGSHAIAQLSDMVIGLERNQQGDNPNVTTVRVLKNRFSGETGEGCHLLYDRETGRLEECNPEFANPSPNGEPEGNENF